LVAREFKKVVLLFELLYLEIGVIWTLPCWSEIRRFLEGFAPYTVCPLIFSSINISTIKRLLKH
jgi:hypothetical protein